MKLSLKQLFSAPATADPAALQRLAVAQLLLEIARLDQGVQPEELQVIRTHLAKAYGLEAAQLDALVQQAAGKVEQSISLHDTVAVINQSCSAQDKAALIRGLWEVAYADRRLDGYEEALLRRLADLLYVPHSTFIREKLGVMGGP